MSGPNTTFDGGAPASDVIESRDLRQDGGGKDARKVRQLTFVAGVPSYLACVAVGGYPPPEVRVHLGQVGQVWSVVPRRCRRLIDKRRQCFVEISPTDACLTRMWANAQPDGRPAEHRWRPLFNAAKFG